MAIKLRRTLMCFLAAALSSLIILPIAACTGASKLSYLKAEGTLVLNEKNEEVVLRGVNAGGLFVTEHWMTGFYYGSTPSNDYKSLTQTFIDRFGAKKTKKLWAEYRANWWTEQDFKNCADMGMNVIRLPFTYMNVDFDALLSPDYKDAGKKYDFSALDSFVKKAAKYGMYTILDLHGAYGSQSGQDHTGEILDFSQVDFYSNEQLQTLTVKLWGALSKHYKNNPNVAGYDILNEPGEKAGPTSERHWDFYDKVYKAIRKNDEKHIVIFESCWEGENLPRPEKYGWENCMYSFHHYTGDKLTDVEHGVNWNNKIANVTKQNFNVPLYMGEFTCYNTAEKWDYTLDLLNRSNWHWTSWTYKVWGNMAWGIVNIMGDNNSKVDAGKDGYDDILNKFKTLRTNSAVAQKYTFKQSEQNGGQRTLESVFKEYCTAPIKTGKLEAGEYQFYGNEGYFTLGDGISLIQDPNAGMVITLIYHSSGDGSAYLRSQGKSLCVDGEKLTLKSNGTAGEQARFYVVEMEEGWAFVSYTACRYITVNEHGALRVTALKAKDAAVFNY